MNEREGERKIKCSGANQPDKLGLAPPASQPWPFAVFDLFLSAEAAIESGDESLNKDMDEQGCT
jgi:hypothetical protein